MPNGPICQNHVGLPLGLLTVKKVNRSGLVKIPGEPIHPEPWMLDPQDVQDVKDVQDVQDVSIWLPGAKILKTRMLAQVCKNMIGKLGIQDAAEVFDLRFSSYFG